jgi:hypothetical protein
MYRFRRPLWLAALPALLCGARLSAQTCTPGELRVFVLDSQEAPVVEADVRLAAGDQSFGNRGTGTEGFAAFARIPCGPWTVTASKQGFETSEKAVQIASAANMEISLVLTPKMQSTTVDVTETQAPVEQSAAENNEVHPVDVKTLPTNPASVNDILPLEPGIVRTPDGQIKIEGAGQERSAMVVNQSDITDPATGKFGQSIPVDAIETVNILNTPFLAQYGRFTQSVIAVETRRGGEKWHAELNDPFPDFRIRSYHMVGIRNETPRFVLGGPLIRKRLYFISSLQYLLDKVPSRTLPFPYNESKQQAVNSFTQLDYILSDRQIFTATLHVSPQHTNFINPDYFNPQPVTPSYAQQNYAGTLLHRFAILNGLVDSSVSLQRFDVTVGAQGGADMIMTPLGNQGNFFGTQVRSASRTEWLETWSLAPFHLAGTHLLKMGTSLTSLGDQGHFTYRPIDIEDSAQGARTCSHVISFTYRPIDIEDSAGLLEETIDFTNQNPFNRSDLEITAYMQDHWSLSSRLSIDYGARVEHQRLAESLRIAPRVGVGWSPFADQRTVLRAGYGTFYDHLPLDIYTFGRYPLRTITYYAPDGSVIGDPVPYINVIGSVNGPRTFLVHGEQVAGAFSPRGATLNLQLEHSFSSHFRLRSVYTDNPAVGLVVLDPEVLGTTNEIVLNGDGKSRYRQLEVTGKFSWKNGQQLNVTYTRSRSEGNLNTFDSFLGNFPTELVRPDIYSNLPADDPNRFLVWGHVRAHVWDLEVFPIVEFRTGFPYATLDAMQNYVGVPYSNSTRFPDFFSADARIAKNFKVNSKYTLRISLTATNMSNHFNALAVHDNIADPEYGTFFGNYHRRYRGDFEVLF